MTTGKLFGLTLLASAALITTAASAQPARQGGQVFSFALTPGEEVPGPGDTAASGTAAIVVNAGQGRICWDITTAGIGAAFTISGAHIHSAFAGSAGPIVVHLTATKNGTATGCTAVDREKIDAIRKAPQVFYVNVHWTPTFGAGGIRGQMSN